MDLEVVMSASLDSTRAKLERKTVRDVHKIQCRTQGQGILLVVRALRIDSLQRLGAWVMCLFCFLKVQT